MMITPEFVKTMAKYNIWQNKSVYAAASTLSDSERRLDRGAFFGSIHETLSHILWGDQIWMARFADTPKPVVGSIPESRAMVSDWHELFMQRQSFDHVILDWAQEVTGEFLAGELSWYSGALKQQIVKSTGLLVVHMFNHQTHHRGQVNTMLLQANCKLDDTDLFAMEG